MVWFKFLTQSGKQSCCCFAWFFSGLMKSFITCKPSLPNQFLIMGTFSSSVILYIFIWNMFVTSILKFSNSTYLSGAFQLNDSCFRAGLPCLCPCVSLRQAVFVPDLGSESTSCSTITAAVEAWIAVRLTISWIALDSAISAWICIF